MILQRLAIQITQTITHKPQSLEGESKTGELEALEGLTRVAGCKIMLAECLKFERVPSA